MKKVYVAGKLNDDAVGYLNNVHKMIKVAREARLNGYAVYVPCNDMLEGIVDGGFNYGDYFDNSQPWLEASDAVLLVPGWGTSPGTLKELTTAAKKSIPAFRSVEGMNKWFKHGDDSEIYKVNTPWPEKD